MHNNNLALLIRCPEGCPVCETVSLVKFLKFCYGASLTDADHGLICSRWLVAALWVRKDDICFVCFKIFVRIKSHGPRQHRGPCDWILTNFLNALVMRRTILHDQFWLFAGQCKSVAGQWKLLYIFGSKVAICVGEEFD